MEHPYAWARHEATNSEVVLEATLVLADVAVIFAQVALVLVDLPVVLVNVAEVLNGFAEPAVGEVLDELLGVLPTVPAILTQVLPILVLLNFIAYETAGVLEHAGMGEGRDREGRENREHKSIGLRGLYSVGAEENSSRATDDASGPGASL